MAKKKIHSQHISHIGKNISNLMEACGIDATELAQQTGLPPSTICRLRSNSTECSPNLSSLVPIADYFCITISQLIGEEPINQTHATFKPNKIKRYPIPILTAETIADYLETSSISDAPFITIDLAASNKTFAFYLQGNAMEPQFPDSTLLIIDPTLQVENLDHVLIIPAGKKFPIFRQILIEGEEQYIRTLNPAFNEFTKLTPASHAIIGVMIQSRRNFKEIELPVQAKNLKHSAGGF